MKILRDLKALIVSATGGDTFNEGIKLMKVPDQPVDIGVLRDTGAVTPDANATFANQWQRRTFQVYVRTSDYEAGLDRCQQYRDVFVNRAEYTGTENFYRSFIIESEFQPIGQDELGNYEFTGNFSVFVRPL